MVKLKTLFRVTFLSLLATVTIPTLVMAVSGNFMPVSNTLHCRLPYDLPRFSQAGNREPERIVWSILHFFASSLVMVSSVAFSNYLKLTSPARERKGKRVIQWAQVVSASMLTMSLFPFSYISWVHYAPAAVFLFAFHRWIHTFSSTMLTSTNCNGLGRIYRSLSLVLFAISLVTNVTWSNSLTSCSREIVSKQIVPLLEWMLTAIGLLRLLTLTETLKPNIEVSMNINVGEDLWLHGEARNELKHDSSLRCCQENQNITVTTVQT